MSRSGRATRWMTLVAMAALGCPSSPTAPAPAAAKTESVAKPPPATKKKSERRTPRLVVLVVVDQMRADYLDRFRSLFDDGLARLLREGARFTSAEIAHAVTMTSPGHATLSTGAHPRHHGVIQNDWVERATTSPTYAAGDPSRTIVGPAGADTSTLEGRSPRSLRRATIGQWLRKASPTSKVMAIGFKDRSTLLLAGMEADGAYWYEPSLAGYVSSSVYGGALPPWVLAFDASGAVDREFGAPWERTLAAERYNFVGADAVAAEGDGVEVSFPHRLDQGEGDSRAIYHKKLGTSPIGDALTLELASAALGEAGLGDDDAPDLLLLTLSSADLIGHAYGPESHEIVDYYVRLDRRLGDLLRSLDAAVPGAYVVALTSDHGAAPLPELARERGALAERVISADFDAAVGRALAAARRRVGLRAPFPILDEDEALWFDLRDAGEVDAAALRAAAAAELVKLPFVAAAYTYEELAGAPAETSDPLLRRYRLSFDAERSPDIQLRAQPGWLINTRPRGTSHGSPYDYDSRVPLIFFGAGIPRGEHPEPVKTVDVAPTLAELLGVTPTEPVDGTSLLPLIGGGARRP
ncbi:MAG: alkaline phosphatase family protein [Nannocystaceae bacterium]